MTAETRPQYIERAETTVYLALELSRDKWELGFTIGLGQRPRRRGVQSGDLAGLLGEISKAKARFGLAPTARVVSCYEAGRDGFWLHRFLRASGVESHVVDSASIQVHRRRKRAKSDGLDVEKLLTMLIRYDQGERKVWSVVNVPSVEEEDHRHLHRELIELKRERTRLTNRIVGLLFSVGVRLESKRDLVAQFKAVRLWDGRRLPPGLHCRLLRAVRRVEVLEEQIRELEAERLEIVREAKEAPIEKVRQLMLLKGIGINSAWLYVMEFFGWRRFRNRKQVGALAGLTPMPYQSGGVMREQGISKAGNRLVRAMAVEIAWGWLRFQPQSKLSRWYQERFGGGGPRARKVGIVALARKLLVALWRYLETGALPEGAVVTV
jgi:transposase